METFKEGLSLSNSPIVHPQNLLSFSLRLTSSEENKLSSTFTLTETCTTSSKSFLTLVTIISMIDTNTSPIEATGTPDIDLPDLNATLDEDPRSRPNLQLPTNKTLYKTFIDNGCELNEQDYPVYPNGKTVFVKDPAKVITNFRFIGWTHTMRSETTKKKDWRIRRYYCLGVMKCSDENCPLAASPPTAPHKLSEILDGYVWMGLLFQYLLKHRPHSLIWSFILFWLNMTQINTLSYLYLQWHSSPC